MRNGACTRVFTNFLLLFSFSLSCVCVCARVLDPSPVLEASYSLEERLTQLQSSSPDSEVLVREISGHWKRHLECLNGAGQLTIFTPPIPPKHCTLSSNQLSKNTGQKYWKYWSHSSKTRPPFFTKEKSIKQVFLLFKWLCVPVWQFLLKDLRLIGFRPRPSNSYYSS